MITAASCRKCGAPVTMDARGGVCPQCLFKLAAAGIDRLVSPSVFPSEKTQIDSFGDYELVEEIARGGMGVVYKARQKSLGRLVAVKLILAGQFAGKQIAQRFKSEAIAAAVLQHPNIVAIHEVGVHEGQHFFSMDYVEGQNLTERIAQRPLPPREAARYVKLIAEAIHYAHGQGILHRDLKPSNVLIDAATDQPRVTDFGLAKRLDGESSLTVTGQVLGSPHFMPPEQAGTGRGKVGRPSDVFGLGGILYFLLTARAPFQGETVEATIEQVLHVEPVSPRLLNPAVTRDLETICLKCLEKEPARRYPTAGDLGEELERYLGGEPIRARPVSQVESAWRWCRRKPAVAAFATATILLLLAGAIGSAIAAWRIAAARNAEHRQRERAEQNADETLKSQQHARRLLYAAEMNLAQQSLRQNNLGRALRLLERHKPQPGEEDIRGWEWRYLWQLTRNSALITLTNRPTTRGFSVSFSPDGTRLAVGWYDGRVDLWDVPDRRWVRALTDRECRHQGRVAFSPVRNLLAATSESKVVALYDLDSGQETNLWRAPEQGAWEVRDLEFSHDGSRLVIYAGIPSAKIHGGSTPVLGEQLGDQVWVVNASSFQIESRHPTLFSAARLHGGARLSPDNRRLYLARSDRLNHRYSIQCIDLATDKELWQTRSEQDAGLTALAISPDGRMLASGSGYEDPTIRVWDAATGRFLVPLDGHTASVFKLAFTTDGRRLISAAGDQSIRFWDTSTWKETQVLRGHTDEVHAVAISEPAQLIASAGKDGNLMLWKEDGKSATDGYRRLPEGLDTDQILPLDNSRVLLLPSGKPPELVNLKDDSPSRSLLEIGSSTDVLGWFDTNMLCHWNGTNQILVRELRGADLIERGAITLNSGIRPSGFACNSSRQLLAWTEGTSSTSLYLVSLAAPDRRIELRSDVLALVPLRFSQDGKYLAASTKAGESLRAWNVESGQIVASIGERIDDAAFAAGGRVLVVSMKQGNDHEIRFYDLTHPNRPPRRVPGSELPRSLAVSPNGGLVAWSTDGALVRLFDAAKGELTESLHGHLVSARGVAFSADGRRLISASSGREAAKLWDVSTGQELLTLGGTGSALNRASWSADGDVILVGAPWQAWRAPSWEEIAAAEAKEKVEIKQP